MISVLIPVKNGGGALRRCLAAVAAQRVDAEVEVVVVDSGSTDGSVDVARESGAIVHEIPPAEFGHGSARNLAASLARGQLLVFTTQDAEAADELWLARLTEPLRRDEVAGVYGRQLPHADATPMEEYFLDFLYGGEPRDQRAARPDDLTLATTLFSNVSSAMRRETWERFPFAEDLIMSEDQEWAVRVLLAGLTIVYQPTAVVRHSHAYSVGDAFRRFFDSGVSAERAYLSGRASGSALRGAAARYAVGELVWLRRTGRVRWIPQAVAYELAKLAGLQLGARHRRLPLAVKRRLSGHPRYWDRLRDA